MNKDNDKILEALVYSVDHLMGAKFAGVTFFGRGLGTVSPYAVEILQRQGLSYNVEIENGTIQLWDGEGKVPTSNFNGILGTIYAGEPEFLGTGFFAMDDRSSTPTGLKKNLSLRIPEINESLYCAFQSHIFQKATLVGIKGAELDGHALAPAPIVNYLDEPDFNSYELASPIEIGKDLTARLDSLDSVVMAKFALQGSQAVQRFVRSDGTTIIYPREHARATLLLDVRNYEDEIVDIAVPLYRNKTEDLISGVELFNDPDFLMKKIGVETWSELVKEMKNSTHAKPGVHNVVMCGSAMGVYFHEGMLAHLVSLEYLVKDINNTFHPTRIGQLVLPDFITLIDDPTIPIGPNGEGFGSYPYDDQGVKPQKVVVVDKGKFTGNYLSDRISAGVAKKKFPELTNNSKSNGHARLGVNIINTDLEGMLVPQPRLSNLVVETPHKYKNKTVEGLVEDLGKQGGGYYFIAGGGQVNPMTGNFILSPNITWEITPNGNRKMVIGAFPTLNALSLTHIKSVSEQIYLNGGYCGAESGFVPTSDLTPAAYLEKVTVQLETPNKSRAMLNSSQ